MNISLDSSDQEFPPHPHPPLPVEACRLIGGWGLFVQSFMLVGAILVLVVKRKWDHPPRKFAVWVLDIAKIGLAQFSGHLYNVLVALWMARRGSDQCAFQLESIMIQDSVSVFTVQIVYSMLEKSLIALGVESAKSGMQVMNEDKNDQYLSSPNPVRINYSSWFLQTVILISANVLNKSILLTVQMHFHTRLYALARVILGFIFYPVLKLIFVMIILPFILSITVLILQDSLLKFKNAIVDIKKKKSRDENNINMIRMIQKNNDNAAETDITD